MTEKKVVPGRFSRNEYLVLWKIDSELGEVFDEFVLSVVEVREVGKAFGGE